MIRFPWQKGLTMCILRKMTAVLLWLLLVLPGGGTAQPSPGKFYLVGLGPAGPEHATLKALETIQKADLILCHPELAAPFQAYLQGKKVLDPWKDLWPEQNLRQLTPEARQELIAAKERQREAFLQEMQARLRRGENIALLTGGDPTVYSRAFWLMRGLEDSAVEIIPGLGAVTAAMAALKRPSTGGKARFVLLTSAPSFLSPDDGDLAKDLSRYNGTLVFYMGLKHVHRLIHTLRKHHPGDLPVAIVYYAGYPDREKVIRGTLDDILTKVEPGQEQWWGMIIVGRCLTGTGFTLSD